MIWAVARVAGWSNRDAMERGCGQALNQCHEQQSSSGWTALFK